MVVNQMSAAICGNGPLCPRGHPLSRSARYGSRVGALFALMLPGLVVLLVALAAVEHAWSRLGRRSSTAPVAYLDPR